MAFLRKKVNVLGFHEMYYTTKKLGKGSEANVYKSIRLEDGKEVAIKAVNKPAAGSQTESNLIKHIRILRRLDHPNVSCLFEVC